MIRLLRGLSVRDRQILRMWYVESASESEICNQFGLSCGELTCIREKFRATYRANVRSTAY